MTVDPTPTPEIPARAAGRVAMRRARAEERRATADAAARRHLDTEAARLRLAQEARAAARKEQAERDLDRHAARDRRRTRREEARERIATRIRSVTGSAAAAWSTVVYTVAVATAAGGQVSIAIDRLGWWAPGAVCAAVFIEGLALAMALTARDLRLDGEHAVAPRVLTWVAASFAAVVNGWAHADDPIAAGLLAGASLAGITVWEIRSGAKNRPKLRERGMIRRRPPRLGGAYWLRFPGRAFDAWSACIAQPEIERREEALAAGEARRAARAAARWRHESARPARNRRGLRRRRRAQNAPSAGLAPLFVAPPAPPKLISAPFDAPPLPKSAPVALGEPAGPATCGLGTAGGALINTGGAPSGAEIRAGRATDRAEARHPGTISAPLSAPLPADGPAVEIDISSDLPARPGAPVGAESAPDDDEDAPWPSKKARLWALLDAMPPEEDGTDYELAKRLAPIVDLNEGTARRNVGQWREKRAGKDDQRAEARNGGAFDAPPPPSDLAIRNGQTP